MKKDIRLISFDKQSETYDFNWAPEDGTLSGRDRLVQEIVKRILTLKGSNKFDPQFGENFYNLFGVIDRSRVEKIKEIFPVLIQSLEDSIKEKQIQNTDLKPQEKLESLNLQEVEFDKEFNAWIIKIRVITQDLVPVTLTL